MATKYGVPMAVTGFEPLDLTQGILQTVRMLEEGRVEVENAYPRLVTFEGNRPAQGMIGQVFQERDRKWRGIGMIPNSGWGLRPEFDGFNAEKRFNVGQIQPEEIAAVHCRAGVAGSEEAARMHRFWRAVHPRDASGSHDGLLGRGVRGLLSL